jgi:uncharacterized membrane protein
VGGVGRYWGWWCGCGCCWVRGSGEGGGVVVMVLLLLLLLILLILLHTPLHAHTHTHTHTHTHAHTPIQAEELELERERRLPLIEKTHNLITQAMEEGPVVAVKSLARGIEYRALVLPRKLKALDKRVLMTRSQDAMVAGVSSLLKV